MRRDDTNPVLCDVGLSHADQVDIFAAVVIKHLVSGLELFSEPERLVAVRFRRLGDVIAGFALRLGAVDEFSVAFRIIENFLHAFFVCFLVNVRSLICQIAHKTLLLM